MAGRRLAYRCRRGLLRAVLVVLVVVVLAALGRGGQRHRGQDVVRVLEARAEPVARHGGRGLENKIKFKFKKFKK